MRFVPALCSLLLLACLSSPAQAQWTPETPVVLKGKVVSMHRGVKRGQVVIRNGKVEAILGATTAPPAGAIVIDTKGYIYPGLINLHNHMRYNFVSVHNVPKATENHNQWGGSKAYAAEVNNPAQIVTGQRFYRRLDEALKFAEVRSLVGGTTSVQGAENKPSIKSTLVRNVELPNFGEDKVGQRAFTIDKLFWKSVNKPGALDRIKQSTAWIFHVAEGVDDEARREWSFPGWDANKPFSVSKSAYNKPGAIEADLVWPGLVGVHCTAMKDTDFAQWRTVAGSVPKMVWSPTSNMLLYGKTTDLRAAFKSKALVALGTDWSPTGTKNLLWELKAAHEINQQSSPRLFRGYRRLIETVTTTPAKILGWGDRVGQIRPGFYADVIVVDDTKKTTSGYKNLILATEENIQLVFVGGNPLYGDEALMQRLKTYAGKKHYEVIPETKGSRTKAIDMKEDPDVLLGDMSLAEVRDNLLRALKLDTDDMLEVINAGIRETQTRINYKNREYIKTDLAKLLRKKNLPVPPELEDEDAKLKKAHLEEYLKRKFPHLSPIPRLESLYTDEAFLDALSNNVNWREHGVDLDLSGYLPATPFAKSEGAGITSVLNSTTSD